LHLISVENISHHLHPWGYRYSRPIDWTTFDPLAGVVDVGLLLILTVVLFIVARWWDKPRRTSGRNNRRAR
jgi:hypothetical protein